MRTRLSVQQKYRICQAVVGLSFVVALYCLRSMGWSQTPHHNKVMFGVLMTAIVVALPFGLGFYYYRAKLHNVDTGAVQVAALAQAGRKDQPTDATKTDKPV